MVWKRTTAMQKSFNLSGLSVPVFMLVYVRLIHQCGNCILNLLVFGVKKLAKKGARIKDSCGQPSSSKCQDVLYRMFFLNIDTNMQYDVFACILWKGRQYELVFIADTLQIRVACLNCYE